MNRPDDLATGADAAPRRRRSSSTLIVNWLLPRTVRGRLVGMTLLITAIVLFVSMTAILVHDLYQYRSSWADDVATEAGVVAMATAPALAFEDREAATRNLAAVSTRQSMLAVAVYLPDGSLFASRVRTGQLVPQHAPVLPTSTQDAITIRGQVVEIAQRIRKGDEILGTIYLRARYDIVGRVAAYLGIFAFITGLSALLALYLSARLQRTVTEPLENIADLARQVVHRRDYALRLPDTNDEEFGIVVLAFNRMLAEVESRTKALEQSNVSLLDEIAVRKATESALALANARLESTMAAAEIGSWIWDPGKGTFDADRNVAALYGLPDASALRDDTTLRYGAIHEEDRRRVEEGERAALQTGVLASSEYRLVQPDGSVRWVVSRGKRSVEADGSPGALVGLLIDVTAQKLAEQERRDSERVYRAIGESINYGVWLTDADGRNTYASDSFLRLTGMTQAECSDVGWVRVLHPADVHATVEAWQACVKSGQPWYREHRIRDVHGQYQPVLAQGLPIRREDGTIYAWAGINLDISRMKRTEDALREADRRKDDFLATLAHELRNPLAPIRNAADLLQQPSTTESQRQWAHQLIGRQVRNMAVLLDDLLDVSRITRGRLEIKPQPVELETLVLSAIETARPLIDAKHHRLEVDLPPTPLEITVDPLRFAQALSNLLTNAAKYTDARGVLRIATTVSDAGLRVSVSDNGIGLSAAALTQVFEMFSQVETALDRSEGGLGIGLALVRGLLALHGGTVEAHSAGPGCGSTFTLCLPPSVLTRAAALPTRASLEQTSAGVPCTILVADDNHDTADSLAALLRAAGHEVSVAYSGTQALECANQTHPQVLVLDIGMPHMNGYELARRVRESVWAQTSLLIAITGWGQQEDVDRAREAGFDLHFRKPVYLPTLTSHLAEFSVRLSAARYG